MDSDGLHIRNLLITLFWSLCPELIFNGHLYAALPPLYRITTRNNEYIYLKDKDELERYKNEHKGEKYIIGRNKGLGEQNPSELAECLLDKQTRNLTQIIVSDKEKAGEMIEVFMGKDVQPRREFILQHSEEADDLW